jgi:hypothetical protein
LKRFEEAYFHISALLRWNVGPMRLEGIQASF